MASWLFAVPTALTGTVAALEDATWIAVLANLDCNPSNPDCNPGLQSLLQSRLAASAAGIPGNLDCNPDCQGARLAVCKAFKILNGRGSPESWVNLARLSYPTGDRFPQYF